MKITNDNLEDIKSLYLSNKPSSYIAEKYGKSEWWVVDKLKRFGVPIRKRGGGIYLVDLTSKKFGKYTVLYRAPNDGNQTRWVVKCDCGNVREVYKQTLINGTAKSCGKCHDRKNWKGCGEISGNYWSCVRQGANRRKIPFDIPIQYGWKLYLQQQKKCAISGLEVSFIKNYSSGGKGGQTASLDRIDSSKGYVKGNVQWVHKAVNVMKWNMTEDYFFKVCKAIVEYRKL